MSTPVERIQQFILARLDENAEQSPRWQVVLDKILVKVHSGEDEEHHDGAPVLPCTTLCLLALRWPEHPEFDPRWNVL